MPKRLRTAEAAADEDRRDRGDLGSSPALIRRSMPPKYASATAKYWSREIVPSGPRLGSLAMLANGWRPLSWAMENKRPTYAVYRPPMSGFPFLGVILAVDGTATARPFDTAEDAAAFNSLMAKAEYPGDSRN